MPTGGENVFKMRTRKIPDQLQKEQIMNYALLIAQSQAGFDLRNDPVKSPGMWEAWKAYSEALQKAGVIVHGAGLQPPQTATTVRVRDGKRQVQDGPYAETKELVAGIIIIDVPNLDAALEWAARCPVATHGSIEVRPVFPAAATLAQSRPSYPG
jgi:hypothetical protein